MLDVIINRIPQPLEEKDKPKLIRFLRHRCDANFHVEQYQGKRIFILEILAKL